MTEAEWLSATEMHPMLDFLRGKVSDRRLRLLGCGCCRRIWHLLLDDRGQKAVELAEESADYPVPLRQLDVAFAEAWEAYEDSLGNGNQDTPAGATWAQLADASRAASYASNEQITVDILLEVLETVSAADERIEQAFLIRDVFGNSFHPVAVHPSWLTSDVQTLAEGIYQDRAFDRMPILADALQDAGCDNEDILSHCRGDGLHVRGCWVVDLLLGKD